MYLVTGATGKAGRQVVEALRAAGAAVRALTRDPERADLPADVEVVAGDLSRPDTLTRAFDGVRGVHLITTDAEYAALTTGPELAALASDAERVVLLWNAAPGPVEAAFAAGPVPWVRLEPVDFMGNALAWAEAIRTTGEVRAPFADVAVAVVDEHDVGAASAALLLGAGRVRATYGLTGPEPLTVPERVATLAAATGRAIGFTEQAEDEARAGLRAAGHADELIELLIVWQRDPPPAATTASPTVRELTGRPARPFAVWAAEHRAAFVAPRSPASAPTATAP